MRLLVRLLGAIVAMIACASVARAESLLIDGVSRTFTAQLAGIRPTPLVIVLHGNTQSGADMIARTSWPAVARRERFGVVFPDGLNRAWADTRPNSKRAGFKPPDNTDDVSFIAKLVEKYVADGAVDPKTFMLRVSPTAVQ